MNPYIEQTRQWIEQFVIGLGLCPFAAQPFRENHIRYVLYKEADWASFLTLLANELSLLGDPDNKEYTTTVFIHPNFLIDFLEYNDFLGQLDVLIQELQLEGVVQVASFHPDYQFADTDIDDASNYSNRSPYPMLHFLLEREVENAVNLYPDAAAIPEKNIQALQQLGNKAIKEILNAVKREN